MANLMLAVKDKIKIRMPAECSGLLLGIRRMLAVLAVVAVVDVLRIRHLRIDRPLKDHLNFIGFSIAFRIKY